MKYFFLFLSISLCCFSCEKNTFDPDRNPDLEGTWKVMEQYIDPGDGSGGFEDVEFDQTFEFRADGTIVSNKNLCAPLNGSGPEMDSRGVYDATEGTIEPNDCDFNPFWGFVLEGNQLSISFRCHEGCGVRLRKLR